MMKIWKKYFLKETLKVFLLVIFCFYGLYILIDYSCQSYSYNTFQDFLYHYTREFIQRADVLVPFALLIACIRTLTQLNTNNELVALMSSGIKVKTLLRPFILLGLFFTALIYLNTQFLLPQTLREIRHINDARTLAKLKKNDRAFVQHVRLKDQSTLLFQQYDSSREMFFDAYWIRSIDDIYRIKYLFHHNTPPTGKYIDHLVRNDEGKLVKIESMVEHAFPRMKFNKKKLLDTVTPSEELSLSKLWKRLPGQGSKPSEKEAAITATFFQKLVTPWLCLLAIIGPAPFCIRFSRNFPVFFIYALSLFGLVACYLLIDAAVILGSRQVLHPVWSIGLPISLFMGIFLGRYALCTK